MLIFVDESGSFTMPQAGKRNLSCVGALIVPETVHNDLISDFVNLRNTWGESQQEVKGYALNGVASAIVCDGVSTAAVVFAPEYGNEDEHQI